jgi:hypothetical protein
MNSINMQGGFLFCVGWNFPKSVSVTFIREMRVLTKSQGSPESFQKAPRKLQKISGQKSRNDCVGILEETNFS